MHRAALLLCLALPFSAPAQEDPDFQFLQSLTQTRYWQLGRPTSIRVTPDGSAVLFLRGLPRKPEMRLFAFDVKSAQVRELITPEQVLGGAAEQLSPVEAARRERMRVTSRGFTSYEPSRSEEHTSELQSHSDLVCRLLLEKKKIEINGKTKDHTSST